MEQWIKKTEKCCRDNSTLKLYSTRKNNVSVNRSIVKSITLPGSPHSEKSSSNGRLSRTSRVESISRSLTRTMHNVSHFNDFALPESFREMSESYSFPNIQNIGEEKVFWKSLKHPHFSKIPSTSSNMNKITQRGKIPSRIVLLLFSVFSVPKSSRESFLTLFVCLH